MKKIFIKFPCLFLPLIGLVACTSNKWPLLSDEKAKEQSSATFITSSGEKSKVEPVKDSSVPISGNISKSMDEIDKSKMWHALDNPIGKSTQWVNARTGFQYTITPTEKVIIDGNQFCRKYTSAAIKGNQSKEMSGVACISSDGNWHAVKAD